MTSILICSMSILVLSSCLIPEARSTADECRHLEFREDQAFKGQRLTNHMIRSADVMDKDFCGALCFLEHNCLSYNFMPKSKTGNHKCELNNATHEGHEKDLEENPDYEYRGTKNHCANNPCNEKATCQTGFTQKGYRCLCPAGFTGQDCSDIDECAEGTHSCDANAECINTKGSYNCTCKPGYLGDGRKCEDVDECTTGTHNCTDDDLCNNMEGSFNCTSLSCKDGSFNENKAYELKIGSQKIKVYCVVSNIGMGPCGGGGWTLVMKIDGTKETFKYSSDLWTNNETFNLAGGESGFDFQETKLPTYWSTPFSKICLGMKIPGEATTNFIVINQAADSLYSLIADGQHRPTSLGHDTWKTLLASQNRLQRNCNREGFNAHVTVNLKARIGIYGNNEDDCNTCDSFVGFGAYFYSDYPCGDRLMKVMGYILIQ
ncbi:hypothetical protein ACROYT_G040886 [Oculina patagonica]